MARFATIDLHSGFVFWAGIAADAADACAKTDLEVSNEVRGVYERINASNAAGRSAYSVYEIPADLAVHDGQDADTIAAVDACPSVGVYALTQE